MVWLSGKYTEKKGQRKWISLIYTLSFNAYTLRFETKSILSDRASIVGYFFCVFLGFGHKIIENRIFLPIIFNPASMTMTRSRKLRKGYPTIKYLSMPRFMLYAHSNTASDMMRCEPKVHQKEVSKRAGIPWFMLRVSSILFVSKLKYKSRKLVSGGGGGLKQTYFLFGLVEIVFYLFQMGWTGFSYTNTRGESDYIVQKYILAYSMYPNY